MRHQLTPIREMVRGPSVALLAVAMLTVLSACKRNGGSGAPAGQNAPSVARPPRLSGPTTESAAKENREKLLAEFYLLTPLGEGVAEITPDGEGWTRFRNGLMIHDLRRSTEGLSPRLGQTVKLTYVGTIAGTGRVFDRRDASNPLTFTMGSRKLIEGFSLGISTMRVGGIRRIYVPPDLGYGATGNPRAGIAGNQPLIFEVELLDVTGKAVELEAEDVLYRPEVLGPPAPPPSTAVATQPSAASSPATRP